MPDRGDRPIFLEIADQIADDILVGAYPEESQVPSTTELSAHYRINPATAGKALNRLVDDGIIYKRRGLGMFVSPGAPQALREQRQQAFAATHVRPLAREAQRLGLSTDDIITLVRKEMS